MEINGSSMLLQKLQRLVFPKKWKSLAWTSRACDVNQARLWLTDVGCVAWFWIVADAVKDVSFAQLNTLCFAVFRDRAIKEMLILLKLVLAIFVGIETLF